MASNDARKPPNPPAFPRTAFSDGRTAGGIDGDEGMSLRDYFAGQVISQCQVTVRKGMAEPDAEMVNAYAERFARTAYAIADALLKARVS